MRDTPDSSKDLPAVGSQEAHCTHLLPELVFEGGSGFEIAPKPKTNDMKTHKTNTIYCCVRPVLLRVLAQHSLVLSLRQIEAPGESSAWHRGRSGFRFFACLLVRDANGTLSYLRPAMAQRAAWERADFQEAKSSACARRWL